MVPEEHLGEKVVAPGRSGDCVDERAPKVLLLPKYGPVHLFLHVATHILGGHPRSIDLERHPRHPGGLGASGDFSHRPRCGEDTDAGWQPAFEQPQQDLGPTPDPFVESVHDDDDVGAHVQLRMDSVDGGVHVVRGGVRRTEQIQERRRKLHGRLAGAAGQETPTKNGREVAREGRLSRPRSPEDDECCAGAVRGSQARLNHRIDPRPQNERIGSSGW